MLGYSPRNRLIGPAGLALCPHLIGELVLWAVLGLTPGVCDPTACVLQSSGEQLESCKSELRDKPRLHLSSGGRRITILTLVSSAKLRGNRIACSRWLGLCCQGCVGTGCRSWARCTWASTCGLWLSLSLLQHINPVAASLIQKMLQTDPTARPTIHELLSDEFFTSGYIPARLPITCLTIPPRFSIAPSSLDPSNRKPLSVLNKGKTRPGQTQTPPPKEPRLPCVGGWPRVGAAAARALAPWPHPPQEDALVLLEQRFSTS